MVTRPTRLPWRPGEPKVHSLCSGEAVPTQALSGGFVTRPSVPTQAPVQAALAVGPQRAVVLAVAPDEPREAAAGPGPGLAEGPVLTETGPATPGAPVSAVTV